MQDFHANDIPRVSKAHEDYLEAVVELGGTPTHAVRAVDVATQLDVSKASVHKAMSALKELGMLDQPHYGGVTLTQQGFEYGTKVLERHRMLVKFMTKALGIDAETADEEACLMEHAISDRSFELWGRYIDGLSL